MGVTSSSEDSSELWFLLVENYNYLTAPVGLRFGWEFFDYKMIFFSLLPLFALGAPKVAEKKRG